MPTRSTILRVPVARKGFPPPPALRGARLIGRAALDRARRRLSRRNRPASYGRRTITRLVRDAGIAARVSALGLRLSPREPFVANRGSLYFFQPAEYRTEQDETIMFDAFLNGGSFLGIHVRADPGTLYVLDMRVSGAAALTFETIPTPGSILRPDAQGHVLMVVRGAADGRADVALNAGSSGLWVFHDVVVHAVR